MTVRLLVLGLVIVCAACTKTVVGTETGNPPVLTARVIMVEGFGEDGVRVSGEPGAITPGGGEISITNTSRGGEPVVTSVAEDGSFSVEVAGEPDDDYELVASNAAGRSPARTVSGSGPTSGDWQTLHMCADADPMDPLTVTELRIEGDTLHVGVSHAGGCAEHSYGLCYADAWDESNPIQVGFRVLHDDGGDGCEAERSQQLSFDLTRFRAAYAERYRTEAGAASLGFSSCAIDGEPRDSCGVLYAWGDRAADCGPPIRPTCPTFELPDAPATWVEHATKCGFSFRAPGNLMELDVQGTDSCVDEFEGDACRFMAGSGLFSGGFAELEDADEYEVGHSLIQGFDAKLVTAVRYEEPNRQYLAGVYFPQPPFATGPGVTADFLVSCTTRAQRDAMLPTLGTIRFQ
jgi:hypothetical protein